MMHLIETLSMKPFLYTHGQGESLINVCAGWLIIKGVIS